MSDCAVCQADSMNLVKSRDVCDLHTRLIHNDTATVGVVETIWLAGEWIGPNDLAVSDAVVQFKSKHTFLLRNSAFAPLSIEEMNLYDSASNAISLGIVHLITHCGKRHGQEGFDKAITMVRSALADQLSLLAK